MHDRVAARKGLGGRRLADRLPGEGLHVLAESPARPLGVAGQHADLVAGAFQLGDEGAGPIRPVAPVTVTRRELISPAASDAPVERPPQVAGVFVSPCA